MVVTERVTDINGNVSYRQVEYKETPLPTHITNGIKHHFSVGDQIKYYPDNGYWEGFVIYGDVVRINKKTITISWEGNFGIIHKERVCPSRLNWD